MPKPYGVHWFRRDLRLEGGAALEWNVARHEGRVLGLFCFDRTFLARPDFSPDRFAFFLRTLEALKKQLRAAGGDLLCLDVGPQEGMEKLLARLALSRAGTPAAVSFGRDYEPFALDRDSRMQELLERKHRLIVHTERDHLLIEPNELLKPDRKSPYYQVFTPFKNRWLTIAQEPDFRARWDRKWTAPKLSLRWSAVLEGEPQYGELDVLDEYLASSARACRVELPPAGHAAALERLRAFKGKRLAVYDKARDFPAAPGTSQLSIYLKNGSLTVPEIIRRLDLAPRGPKSKPSQYLTELVWREFYYHLLAHFPRVETEAFDRRYNKIRWSDNEEWFRAWCEGRTGYPIVDAGMRQLNQTGWMHNRVRMIVASFLVKDLHINWQWGERYFMQRLLDGDLAPNNGGWQWAASTGADPVPYFRVFNPTLQGKRFDPSGAYIRRWVPEFAKIPDEEIHNPRDPIVDHMTQKEGAIALFHRQMLD